MKNIFAFLKATATGGLLVVLPLLLIFMLVQEIMGLLVALATPIVDSFPEGTFGDLNAPEILAVGLLLGSSLLIGLLLRSSKMVFLGTKIEGAVLSKLPAYRALKSLTRGLLTAGDEGNFHTAILTTSEDSKELVYVTEDTGGEWVTVLLPWAPAAFAGPLRLVKREHIEVVNVSILDASASFANFGVGTLALLERSAPKSSASTPGE